MTMATRSFLLFWSALGYGSARPDDAEGGDGATVTWSIFFNVLLCDDKVE